MAWERQLSIPEMGKEAQAGTTFRYYSVKSQLEVVAECVYTSNQLRLSVRSGEYVYASEWLDVWLVLDMVATVPLIQEAIERFLARATWLSTERTSGLTPMELTTELYKHLDHILA